jgi:hypothetical protein
MAYRIRQGRPFNQPPTGLDYTSTFLYLLDHLNERVSTGLLTLCSSLTI